MLSITLKNMFKNKLLHLCLAAGFILSIAIVCAVPIYIDSVLNNYINNIFVQAENKVVEGNEKYIYPSSAYFSAGFRSGMEYDSFNKSYSAFKSMFFSEASKIPVPVLTEKTYLIYDSIRYTYTKEGNSYDSINNKILSISDINSHISIISGRVPESIISTDNAIEVIVDKRTFDNFNLEINKTYELLHISKKAAPKMKVVGVFDIKDINEPYWFDKDTNFYCKFMATEEGLINFFEENNDLGRYLRGVNFEILYDYNKITSKNAIAVYKMGKAIENDFIKRTGTDVNYEISEVLKTYAANERLYSVVMWIFLIPILVVVIYYIWMISELIVDSDKEQIAVLKSRGGSKFQILKQYLYNGLLLSSAGLIVGPVLAIALCKAISYSDGFLIFTAVQGIKISFNSKAYLYAFITVIILLATLLTSVFFASQKSIVEVKQSKNRYIKLIFNSRYLDFILLAVALYGYYNYGVNKNVPALAELKTSSTPLDPLLYVLSTIFIVAVGMLLLRIYRYAIKLVFKVGKGRYHTSLYISIINVMRYHLKKSTAMLFVVITVAIGVFNIHVAKDINTSYMNTVKYTTGADMIIKEQWNKITYESMDSKTNAEPNVNADISSKINGYIEPSYKHYSKIEGVDKFTKVFKDDEGEASLNSNITNVSSIIAIIPHEFGTIAYFDSSLLKTHWYDYLNNMTKKPNSVLVSRGLSNSAGIKPGDSVLYKAKGGLLLKGIVIDVVDYWPGFSDLQSKNVVIANFNYMFSRMPIRPYEIWMRKRAEVSNEFIYSSIKSNNIPVINFKDLSIETYMAKTDIFLKGTNSVLNLGFLSIGAITVLGFLVYWVLSLKARTLSFGIYRSLGLSSKGITGILVIEQFLTLGMSVLIGIFAGNMAGKMFIPLIKRLWYENRYVIPANNLQYINEYIQLGAVFALMFIVSFVILARYIKRLKINQAIKLGED